MTFLAIAIGMIAIATVLLVLPLRKKNVATTGEQEENIVILRDQLSQLDIDFAEGRIAADQLQEAQRDIEKRLLLEERAIAADQAPVGAKPKRILFPALLIGIGVPVCSVLLYLWIGNPVATDPLARTVSLSGTAKPNHWGSNASRPTHFTKTSEDKSVVSQTKSY